MDNTFYNYKNLLDKTNSQCDSKGAPAKTLSI